jgi:hypothetical protein
MSTPWLKRTVIGGIAALVLVGGGAIAFAQTQTTTPSNTFQSFLDDVASHLGVTPAALKSAIQAAETDQVNQAVQSGKLTQQQAQNIEGRIQNGQLRPFFGGGLHVAVRGRFGGMALLNQAATYLGITPQQLRSQLQSGQTLAQIANATSGKSASGLQSYLLSQLKTKLDAAVQAGKITADQEAQMLNRAQTMIGNLMNRQLKWGPKPGTQTPPGNATTPSANTSGA